MLTTSAVTFTRVPAITYFESHLSSLNMILRRSAVIKVHLTLRRTFNLIFFEIVSLKHSTFVRTNETRFIKDNFRRFTTSNRSLPSKLQTTKRTH
ncbi:MAG: hypothetical protein ACTS7D_00305 [Candidatus Hodgkinia cicadicola]